MPSDDLMAWLRTKIADERALYEIAAKRRTSKPTLQGYLDLIEAHTAILDAVQRGLDGHPGECINYIGQDPAAYSSYDSCERHIEWAKTTLPLYAAQLVTLAYQHWPGFREEWRW